MYALPPLAHRRLEYCMPSKFYLINCALFVLLRGNHASSRPVGVAIFQAEHD